MQERLKELRKMAEAKIKSAHDLETLKELKIKFLGKKGELTSVLRGMGSLSPEERPVVGALANEIRNRLEELISSKEGELEEAKLEQKLKEETIDVTLPSVSFPMGAIHPLQAVIEELEDIFIGMGFEIAEGPEVETDKFNFEMLNFLKDHPARDMQDSFYITPEILLRTHTSSVQARTMLAKKGEVPVRIICPGKVYRRDSDDATHSHQFMQIEGLVVDRNISMSELKGVLFTFIKKIFGEDTEVRLRPSFFPFTEPSVEVDIYDPKKGWLEILGAGMVHPRVLEKSGYNPERYTGFAFGAGIERIAMLKYGIDDIRHFYNNDLRFLRQFQSE
ncbi:phenylalanine--tRNA ligase subunit alpha [Thermoflavimicrobium dichotomicum]|uniref:Phenylalanine--tRNA ligase alpha subunit n=1 Tax=Thermoflavimicrobium dichotomicum TaxID=46223 RepID=A0A1I3L867_9BACL|nr:phenylalanine--tRNA ligase subunit alpha [Thermoflavimicrobium dichotomicum]SFI80706.1 phenylalanyl-tRNA synthetase alpha chain [Thermoflavimicrobium dichotomicum]